LCSLWFPGCSLSAYWLTSFWPVSPPVFVNLPGQCLGEAAIWHTTRCKQQRSFFQSVRTKYLEWPGLLHLWLLLCVPSLLSFRRGPSPPQCPVTQVPQPAGSSDCSLHDFSLESLSEGLT
jgi:hypothetical protein